MSEDNTEALARLREPFGAEHVGKLPRITCKACSDERSRCCQQHRKVKCDECGNWITPQHIHLDYVGHGAVTDRLLEVDPAWNWEPVATEPGGTPAFEQTKAGDRVGLWIKLTVCGVTRLGYGSCPTGQSDAEKVLIGDALRNAAMRFGVALDLWIKGHAEDDERTTATAEGTDSRRSTSQAATVKAVPLEEAQKLVLAAAGGDKAVARSVWDRLELGEPKHLPETKVTEAEGLAQQQLVRNEAEMTQSELPDAREAVHEAAGAMGQGR